MREEWSIWYEYGVWIVRKKINDQVYMVSQEPTLDAALRVVSQQTGGMVGIKLMPRGEP